MSVGLFAGVSVCGASDELVREGSLCELPLCPVSESISGFSSKPEQIVYYSKGLDDKGLHRAVKNITVPTVTVYRPLRSVQRSEALVICPGGGYGAVVVDREGHAIARYFQEKGLTVAVLKYRLPSSETFTDGLPASQQDALEAIRFLRRHADEWNIDKSRIGIMGFSAGGHLAGSAAVFGEPQDGSRPDFVAMLYPVVAMSEPYVHQGSCRNLIGPAPSAARRNEFSLEHRVYADMPPFFIVHAKNDAVVPYQNSVLLADALEAAHIPETLLLVHEGGHGFALGRGPESSCWKGQFLSWLAALPWSRDVSLRKQD